MPLRPSFVLAHNNLGASVVRIGLTGAKLLATLGHGCAPLAFVLLLVVPLTWSSPKEVSELTREVTLAGLVTGMTEEQVHQVWGDPVSIQLTDQSYGGKPQYWHYDGFSAYIRFGRVSFVQLDSPKFETSRGVRVGHSIEALKRKYGDLRYSEYFPYGAKTPEDRRYEYTKISNSDNKVYVFRINFSVLNGKVSRIAAFIDISPHD